MLLLHKFHPPSHPSQDASMPPHPSPTYERLPHTIAERMRMSPIDQPLMLEPQASAQRLELQGYGFARQQPARPRFRTSPG
ncbi:MAG: hypothetical protein EA413_13420 [Cyanobium sp. PLM2.Bin73]|nr:MAG: hypothetical protein EA413_13420 [Cyanobium sp. PLM2.Bin73]